MQAKGYAGQILIDYESTFGQDPVSPSGLKMPFNSCELKAAQAFIDPATIRNSRSAVAPGLGRLTVEGPLVVPMCYRSIGYWLKAMFGAPTTTNVDTAGYVQGGAGVTTTIGTWTAVTTGSFHISIDGSANDITGLDFSGAATLAAVAALIQTAVRAIGTGGYTLATVAWNATTASFKITSGTTGPLSAVLALTAAATGADISGASFMKCHSAVATTYTGEDLYQHIFKISTSAQPSLVIEKGFTDIGQYFKYNGCKINGFKLVVGEDGELVASIDILGANETISGSSYDSTPTDVTLSRINNFQATLKEGGAETAIVKTAEFNFNMGLDGTQFIIGGGNKRGSIPEGLVAFTGTIKALFNDLALLNKGINSTESSIEVIFASGSKSLSLKSPELMYDRTSPAISGPAGVEIDCNWRAYLEDNADGSSAVLTLINGVATH